MKLTRFHPFGGYDFAADPTIAAADQPIFWTEAASPAVLRFTASRADRTSQLLLGADLLKSASVRDDDDGMHAVWRLGSHQVQGRLDHAARANGAAVVLPLDGALELRVLTAIRLMRLLQDRPPASDPAPLSIARRTRLVHVIRALDARAEGASLRDIAESLFSRRVVGRAWQDSDLQARTRRLIRSGVELVRGGYRVLLNPLARRRDKTGDELGTP